MSVVVKAQVCPRIAVQRVETLLGGGTDTIAIDIPSVTLGTAQVKGKLQSIDASKLWAGTIPLAASTPQTLDLSALAGGRGDTSFSDVTLIAIVSLEDPAAHPARACAVGDPAMGSASLYDPIGASGSVIAVPSGTTRLLYLATATGWAVGTRRRLKLDPGADSCNVLVIIAGH